MACRGVVPAPPGRRRVSGHPGSISGCELTDESPRTHATIGTREVESPPFGTSCTNVPGGRQGGKGAEGVRCRGPGQRTAMLNIECPRSNVEGTAGRRRNRQSKIDNRKWRHSATPGNSMLLPHGRGPFPTLQYSITPTLPGRGAAWGDVTWGSRPVARRLREWLRPWSASGELQSTGPLWRRVSP